MLYDPVSVDSERSSWGQLPTVAEGITRLYTALRELHRQPAGEEGADPRVLITPETWVRDYIQAQRNHFPELEEGAETLGGGLSDPLSVAEPLRRRLKEAYGVEAKVVPHECRRRQQHFEGSADPLSGLLRPENAPRPRYSSPCANSGS